MPRYNITWTAGSHRGGQDDKVVVASEFVDIGDFVDFVGIRGGTVLRVRRSDVAEIEMIDENPPSESGLGIA